MGRHSRLEDLTPEEAKAIADAAMGLSPAQQRAAIGAAFEGASRARDQVGQSATEKGRE